ncbi:MAG: 1-acyl-sn-glycerol-3-phosphate acyltransferase [Candidatus Binatia bacterium]|nr:1-acyl-sn-glycerol-3-phosphate acyltransferase [Candidatus Binatia bacterium]
MNEELAARAGNDWWSEPGPMERLGWLPRWFCERFLAHIRLDPGAVAHIRNLSQQGTVVYVMRYRSLVDYMLVAFVLLREGLPLPAFVSDIPSLLLRPVGEIFRTLWERLRSGRWHTRGTRHLEDLSRLQQVVRNRQPALIFMRGHVRGLPLRQSRRAAIRQARSGTDYLREIVHTAATHGQEVFLVPLAVLRGRGFRRKESRLATLVYSVQEAPGELKRLLSLWWNAKETSITVGRHVSVQEMLAQYRAEGEERVVRRVARALQIFLYREEKLVWGPTLLPKRVVRQIVLGEDEVRSTVRALAQQTGQPESKLWRTAEKYFDEMAANYQGAFFAILEFAFNRIWPRIFQGVDYRGLDKVIECVKQHPVVLVPCHRSHFDYLILSYLFHINYMSPPHIAAGINLSFWPLGPLFRGAGAYFIRRSFDNDPLYKAVFRSYLKFLIREGYTQEFFIEGGRSRTGKILTPKLGMLSAIVNAFISGVRRDLYLVPVSIQYGRVVEEESYKRELFGAEKEKESLWALIRARTVLRQNRGTVYVTFADPISLREALGDRLERFREHAGDPQVEEEKRRFIQKLGFRILRAVNEVAVAGATAVSATVLLSRAEAAWRYQEFLQRAQALVKFLRHRKVTLTASLERNANDFLENLGFLENGGLIRRLRGDEVVIHVPADKRMTLDFYKNNIIHFFLMPALVSRALLQGFRGAELEQQVSWWLDFYRWEFPLPEKQTVPTEVAEVLAYYREEGAWDPEGQGRMDPSHPFVDTTQGLLDNFCEAYWVMARTLALLPPTGQPLKTVLAQARKRYDTALLLGEVRRPEGNSSVTFENAVQRYAELGYVTLVGDRKERVVERGARFAELEALQERLARHLRFAVVESVGAPVRAAAGS